MSIFFNYNSTIYRHDTPVITPGNRSFKYGDGLFETLKVANGEIQLKQYHFDRLFAGMHLLQFEIPAYFTPHFLEEKIAELCKQNKHAPVARVRLTVFRGNGDLYDVENNLPNYIIQSWSMGEVEELNEEGLTLDLYPGVKKSCDKFANTKSNNFLPYAMAAMHAKKNNADDCILLNTYGNICDTTIANIFLIKDALIYTPPLSEGCIAGVMRRAVLETLQHAGYKVQEKAISVEELEDADEVFLTNAIRGIRWVKQFRDRTYSNKTIIQLYNYVQTGSR